MPHNSRKIIEGYALEIIYRSQAIQERCRRLLSKDFASQAPIALAKTLERICRYLEEATKALYKLIDWESISSEDLESFLYRLKDTDAIIRRLGADVRYVDGARTQRLPWSIIRSIEKFIKVLVPEITIMLRPQWKYNYSVAATDLRKKYYSDLDEYQDLLPSKSLEKEVFQDFKQPFHIISFPSLERKNILLHCLLGHEIGHLFSVSYLNKSRSEFLKNVTEEISNIVKSKYIIDLKELPLFRQPQMLKEIQYEIDRADIAWQRGLAEVLSDIVGALLFGPAMLFSVLEIAIQYNLDDVPNPKNSFYPSWRLRLREILKVIQEASQEFFPLPENIFTSGKTIESINKRYELIKEITKKEDDKEAFLDDTVLKIVYKEISKDITNAKKDFYTILENKIIESSILYKRLPHLIDRIDHGIPPNAYENSIDDRDPATIVEIINAAWFHKIAWEDCILNQDGTFNENICKKRERMNRLTLKAIEYADLEKKFRDYNAK